MLAQHEDLLVDLIGSVVKVITGINIRKNIAGFHCHAIKIKIENHSLNEVKKLTRYRP